MKCERKIQRRLKGQGYDIIAKTNEGFAMNNDNENSEFDKHYKALEYGCFASDMSVDDLKALKDAHLKQLADIVNELTQQYQYYGVNIAISINPIKIEATGEPVRYEHDISLDLNF